MNQETDLSKPHIHIAGRAVNEKLAFHSHELLKAAVLLKNILVQNYGKNDLNIAIRHDHIGKLVQAIQKIDEQL